MKAIILAAGYATRLYPLTLDTPKPLLTIASNSLVGHIIKKLEPFENLDEIYVVTNNKFYQTFLTWKNNFSSSKKIKIINDLTNNNETRLGAIGDINFTIKKENIADDLLIIGGDNLFEDNLKEFLAFFEKNGSSIMLNDVQDKELAKLYGIVTLDANNKIIEFTEKPAYPKSTLASALIYALKKEQLKYFQEVITLGKADRTGDFIKHLSEIEKVYGLPLKGRWFDIGSLEQLKEAEEKYHSN